MNKKKPENLFTCINKNTRRCNSIKYCKRSPLCIKAMWVAKSPLRVMGAPHTLQTSQLGCSFSTCFSLSSSFKEYPWKAMEVPYGFPYKMEFNNGMCNSFKMFLQSTYYKRTYLVKLQMGYKK